MKLQFLTDIKDSRMQKNIRELIAAQIGRFNGKRVSITIEKLKKTRSNPQNKYYWGVVVLCQQECFLERWGEIWDKDEVHDWNKNNIWHTEIIDNDTGEVIKKPGSSKAKTTVEFEERLEKLRQKFEIDFEWRIPLPNEQIEMNINET